MSVAFPNRQKELRISRVIPPEAYELIPSATPFESAVFPLDKSDGFTLVELLVAVCIIGILATLGVAQFNQYRVDAYNSVAESALRDVVSANEHFFIQSNQDVSCAYPVPINTWTPPCGIVLSSFTANTQARILFYYGTPGAAKFGAACHSKGDRLFMIKETGGKIESVPYDCSGNASTVLSSMLSVGSAYASTP